MCFCDHTDKPEIDKPADASLAATDLGNTAKLKCAANGVPDVKFTWIRVS